MRVTACIVSWNTAEHLPGALESLLAQTHDDLQIVVIDNNSHDTSAEVAGRVDGVRLVRNDRNRGFAGAANQGLAIAAEGGGDPAFFVMNPDVRLAPDHVAALVDTLRAQPGTASVQGRLHKMDPATGEAITDEAGRALIDTTGHDAHRNRVFRNRGDGEADDGRYDTAAEVFGVSGCAALYRVAALHDVAVGGEVYDEDLFAYFEDVDLDWRLKARGWASRYVPAARGLHERGGDGARRSPLVERLSYRNWFLTVLKNDDLAAMAPDLHLVTATTVLRTADLVLTVPTAFLRAVADVRLARRALAKRRVAAARATVDNATIVEEWFGAFDYRAWFAKRIARGWS